MTFSHRTVEAIVTGAVGLALTLAVRWLLRVSFAHYVRRVAGRRSPDELARLRTRLTVLQRVIVAFLFAIVVWSTLQVFPSTEAIAALSSPLALSWPSSPASPSAPRSATWERAFCWR
jgi:hypothetical protein